MALPALFKALAEAFDGPEPIEAAAREALLQADPPPSFRGATVPLPETVQQVLAAPDAHPACALIGTEPLPWVPPQTSDSADYAAHSIRKVHVELIGPGGICGSDTIRLGLYGFRPDAHYGLRTHPAEETFVMLAGEADWRRGEADYAPHRAGDRSFHPSMMPHATRTRDSAFMSLYVWHGDISTDNYTYHGLPG